MKRFALLFIFAAISITALSAQRNWELGAGAGVASYFGDLNPFFTVKHPGPALNILARKNFDGRICLRLNAGFAHVWANDAQAASDYAKARNLSFQSNILEGSAIIEFNFQDFHGDSRDDANISPYLFAGAGLMYFNPQARYNDVLYDLQPLGTEGQAPGQEYSLVSPVVILGIGLKFHVDYHWSWSVELGHRATFTDYLDDVSGSYANAQTIGNYNGSVAAALSDRSIEISDQRLGGTGRQRGDSSTRDSYMMLTVGFSYRFMPLHCPAY